MRLPSFDQQLTTGERVDAARAVFFRNLAQALVGWFGKTVHA